MHSFSDKNTWSPFQGPCELNSSPWQRESFPSNDKNNQENELNSFCNASQIVDIDLIDYHEISSNVDLSNDISAIDSYFRKKSSLEDLNFMSEPKRKLSTLDENNSLCSTDLFQNLEEIPLNGTSTSFHSTKQSHHANNYSVHFTVTRYSPFSFDFFHIRNSSDRAVMLSITFVNDKRLPSSLTVHEDKLQCLAGAGIKPTNMATFIPLETGAYTITIYVFPLWGKSGDNRYKHQNTFFPSSATVVRCHLNVIDVPIGRPLSDLNGSPVIKLSSFTGLLTQNDVLFRLSDKQSRVHVKPYSLLFELNRHSELITFSGNALHMPTAIKWHFVNLHTCFITFWQASDFVLPMQVKCAKDVDTTPLVLSISTSNNGKALYKLADYQIILEAYPTAQLNGSLIQVSTESKEITANQWKRIDLRNKDANKLVHVSISATLADKEVEWPSWYCTATAIAMPPLTKTTIFFYVNRKAVLEATTNDESKSALFKLNVQQFAGKGTQLTSVLPLRTICTP